ncbi:MAG TPA: argininosuccinate synthase [Kiritimatiellia bacterium]|jgi:argininosuccinate synthase|nr:argininosuccinate synthase [Kiritimatiellia bacterium]HOR98582.1 argininosuccinate synthase [Kiritimatiellia bacterium]HPC49328.1 argininosuccinate synthase [Kiritimatiellia bacterium]HPW76155.1 argininosuccinate synthase [Kiritimatiellia bacterium]
MALTLTDLRGKTVGACVSGGLDSRTIAKVMVEAGVKVVAFSADLGQPDEKNINDIRKRMAPCGVDTVMVDLKEAMAEACFQVIEAQAMYDGGYWNSTGIARAVTVRGLLPEMRKRGCSVLVHGATGRGNDQMRFERYTNVLAPSMKVYSPWRDAELLKRFPGRTQMVDFLAQFGIQAFVGAKKKYSTDANLAGLSHEAEDLESMETSMLIVEPTMGVWPQQAPDKMEKVAVRFVKGRAVQINGKDVTPLEAMRTANRLAGRNGVGMKHALENRIIGTKSRGVYEAPGMELLGTCLRYVYQATMDRRAGLLFGQLSKLVADQIYDGRYFDPVTQAARAAIATFARHASGTVEVGLYKGNLFFNSLTGCKASVYNEADSSMEASDGLNPVSSQGFAEIQSVEARMLARAGQIVAK